MVEAVEVNVLETVLDALECRIAYALQVEGDIKKAAMTMAVLSDLKRWAERDGMTVTERQEAGPFKVKGAKA